MLKIYRASPCLTVPHRATPCSVNVNDLFPTQSVPSTSSIPLKETIVDRVSREIAVYLRNHDDPAVARFSGKRLSSYLSVCCSLSRSRQCFELYCILIWLCYVERNNHSRIAESVKGRRLINFSLHFIIQCCFRLSIRAEYTRFNCTRSDSTRRRYHI